MTSTNPEETQRLLLASGSPLTANIFAQLSYTAPCSLKELIKGGNLMDTGSSELTQVMQLLCSWAMCGVPWGDQICAEHHFFSPQPWLQTLVLQWSPPSSMLGWSEPLVICRGDSELLGSHLLPSSCLRTQRLRRQSRLLAWVWSPRKSLRCQGKNAGKHEEWTELESRPEMSWPRTCNIEREFRFWTSQITKVGFRGANEVTENNEGRNECELSWVLFLFLI